MGITSSSSRNADFFKEYFHRFLNNFHSFGVLSKAITLSFLALILKKKIPLGLADY